MKLLIFYLFLAAPLILLVLLSKRMPLAWFVAGLLLYLVYNLLMANIKLRRKGYQVSLFAHLHPFSKTSQELYHKVYFEP